MTNPKPLFPVNPEGLDEIARKLLEGTPPSTAPPPDTNIRDPENYIILTGKTHGSYSYPDLLVAKQKTLHRKTWPDTHQALHQENSFMLNIRQYIDFINLLRSGTVYNGKGSKINRTEIGALLDEILTVRSPWRAEWLDAKFSKSGRAWNITYHKIKTDGTLEKVTEPLEECLMKDKTHGIDLGDWLNKATYQGLPPKKVAGGQLYYWHPRDGYVARFRADSGRVDLNCFRDPSVSNSALGVRCVKTPKGRV